MDQPSIDGLNTFAVSRFARERGMKVVLSGVGADELFGGYRSFSDVPRLAKLAPPLGRTGPLRGAATNLLSASSDPRHRRLADLLAQPPTLTAAYATYRGIFTRAEARIAVRALFRIDRRGDGRRRRRRAHAIPRRRMPSAGSN